MQKRAATTTAAAAAQQPRPHLLCESSRARAEKHTHGGERARIHAVNERTCMSVCNGGGEGVALTSFFHAETQIYGTANEIKGEAAFS